MGEDDDGADDASEVRQSYGRPTMMDVARAAGVSQSSVSLVLNGMTGARISEATRQRVVAAARDLGYVLPFMRRGLPQGAPGQTIAYIADEISTTVFPVQNIDGARDAAWESGLLVSTHATRSNAQLEATTIEAVRRNPGLIGVIYATIFTREARLPASLEGVPVVLLNCYTGDRRHVSVLPGEVVGGFNATHHLIKHGHRRIGLINGEPWMDASAERLVGYRQALATADIPFDADLVLEGDWLPGSGREHFRTLMSRPARPTAIFCGNDMMALGALQAAAELGLRVPEDISIIGYDDQVVAGYTQPPLTTVLLPNYEMGRKAAELLIDIAVHGKLPPTSLIKIDCPVVVRNSVGPAPH
ncbi:MAG: LacI family DNA-binding transcriptional regulator [Devosia sp.]|nr:LacI family DNA-binding transcriptional regulator [Devosia sp.]